MAANLIHETDKNYNRHGLRAVNHAVNNLGLVDADVLSLTTGAGLVAAIAAKTGTTVHETQANIRRHVEGAINAWSITGGITDAEVAAANTVSGLRTQATDNDSSLTSTDSTSFAYQSLATAT
mgnify:CR=1 FL=1